MSKLIVYCVDTETTSLDNTKGDIIEISFIRTTDLSQKTWHIKPNRPENIEDEALKKNGANKDELLWKTAAGKEKYRLIDDVLPEIENWIAEDNSSVFDRVLVGHNVRFDSEYMKSAWKQAGCMDTYPFSTFGTEIDTKGLVLFYDWIMGQNNKKYNLSACIKKFGLTQLKAHGAADDTKMAYDLLMHIASKINNGV